MMSKMIRKYILVCAIACAAVLVTSGCATAPLAEPAQTDAPSLKPTAVAVDPLTTVTGIVVGPEVVELRDEHGVVIEALSYDDSVDGVVAALTGAIGEAPTVSPYDGGLENPSGIGYEWEGFILYDAMPEDGTFTSETNFSVSVSAPATDGDTAIETAAGHAIGDDIHAAASENGFTLDTTHQSYGIVAFFEYGPTLSTPDGGSGYLNALAVHVTAGTESGAIDSISAPSNPSYWLH